MQIHSTLEAAIKSGAATIIKDSDTEYRCYSAEERPLPPDPVQTLPSVSAWQIRKALNATGLRAQIEAAVAAADQDTKDGWERAGVFERDHPLILQVATALGFSSAQIDDVFELAATL